LACAASKSACGASPWAFRAFCRSSETPALRISTCAFSSAAAFWLTFSWNGVGSSSASRSPFLTLLLKST
jgi:hypothetical protein